jgi:carbamoyl-phosphate synthase small subunit
MRPAALHLEDGTVWPGVAVGAPVQATGEAVFTTAMTGYQEALTDPSFHGQVLIFTAPMIGNYGVEDAADESHRVQVRGMVCHEARNAAPGERSGMLDWLLAAGVPVLCEVDTRALVRHLRDRGAMRALIAEDGLTAQAAQALLAEEPPMAGRVLAAEVSGALDGDALPEPRCRVALVDYGAKASIVRLLEEAGAEVTVVPHDATADEILAAGADGVLLANGPGDPGAMDAHVAQVRGLLDGQRPLFGICLGHQLLGRALGLETFKLPFGHHGANHPVLERDTGRVLVTTQNHGFALRMPDEPPHGVAITHESLYDRTVEGLRVEGRPIWSVQFHPEAAPGPHDAREQLAAFVDACVAQQATAEARS